jgi:peptide/nickel transport system ATP-binding protein
MNNQNNIVLSQMGSSESPRLAVEDLHIDYRTNRRWINAVRNFDITVYPRQIYGIVGESGSGKSTVVKAIMRYLAQNGRIGGGDIYLNDENLTRKPRRQMQSHWKSDMNMVPQNPYASLNPSIRIGEQLAEVVRLAGVQDRDKIRNRVINILRDVRIADPEEIIDRYPHELSGGMQQRVILAMSFSNTPELLILDEPTTSLDVTTEAVILDLVRDLVHSSEVGAIYVTHNLGVIAQLCDRVTVMYAGEIMEDAGVKDLYQQPLHPYTIGLLACVPTFGETKRDAALRTIPGRPPSLTQLPKGCVFAPRCPVAIDKCFDEHPPLEATITEDHKVRCHRWQEIASGELVVEQAYETGLPEIDDLESTRILEVESITKHFKVPRSLRDLLQRRPAVTVKAVDGVNLNVQHGRTLGLVGESGSGKTTLSRLIVGLTKPSDGRVSLMGADIQLSARNRSKEILSQLQMVFQNPESSLNPYHTVGQALRRPLMKLSNLNRRQANREARHLLQAVNLQASYMSRYPGELSGGEKQRVAIARAFASNPELIVCDEPVSSLDVSVQAAVLNLLARLQEENDTAYMFISHDLSVVSYLADYLAVMYLGQLFEVGYGKDMGKPPMHPYTEALVSAIPIPDPQRKTKDIRLSEDVPSPRNLPSGCRFHTRCPRKLGEICENEVPPWRDDGNGHFIRCHIPLEDLEELQQAHPDKQDILLDELDTTSELAANINWKPE